MLHSEKRKQIRQRRKDYLTQVDEEIEDVIRERDVETVNQILVDLRGEFQEVEFSGPPEYLGELKRRIKRLEDIQAGDR